ncbi:peptidase domain-containing ABC transporter [Sphingobium sp. BHU LFT2]|uniref:peptidase domain-containing ABC transporter n=1 Tax=Sphingobium sp. BHU LFT2 TaxID=2807634 RepID=UPI001BE673CA|nr:peptidase domain-containing ABC transporter [Sphingobium sp. BHU LFT2]MBT2244177.1 peptidase domain-containing ABC transporter [Sphingobium sp. BHU LFT2]
MTTANEFSARKRVRHIRQSEATECGLACLAMVASYHGFEAGLGTFRRRFKSSSRGTALADLVRIADFLSLNARPMRIELEELNDIEMPAILHWDLNHFVVLEAVRKGRALIHDPAGSSQWMSMDQCSSHFTGVILEISPAANFEAKIHNDRMKLSQLWQSLTGLKRAVFQFALLSIVLQAYILTAPYFLQLVVDTAIPAFDHKLISVLALGFCLFTLVNAGAELLRSYVMLSAGTSFGFGVATNVGRRLIRLPVSWFERRQIGDVLSRFQSIMPIRQFMVEGAITAVLDGCLAVLTLALMAYYSLALTAVALAGFVTYVVIRIAIYHPQRRAQEQHIVKAGLEQSTMIETMRGISTLRIYNREAERLSIWRNRLIDSLSMSLKVTKFTEIQNVSSKTIVALEGIFSIWVGSYAVLSGGMSLGMLFAFMAYKTEFIAKSSSFVDRFAEYRLLGLHLDRLSDIAFSEPDRSFSEHRAALKPLVGKIELRGVTYQYSPTEPMILKGIDLVVEAGEHVAITGPSGGGKSTLMKVILGLVDPTEGEILIDGVPLRQFGYRNYHEQLAAVLQEDHLFAGTLADNIALFDDQPDFVNVEAAAKIAALDSDIEAMPMGYETLVGDMGSSLSGGQKQRLLLARALYRQPRLLIMDEGTSHLDPAKERQVNRATADLGITRVVVAHRSETIANAERVVKLENGKIEEVATRSMLNARVKGEDL